MKNNDHFFHFCQWKWVKVERNCISWFCLTVRRGAHEIGQVFIKKQLLFHFLEEPKMLKSLMYFLFFSEKLCIKVGVILENVGIFKGKLGMSYLEKLVITKYTKFIIFAHFLWYFLQTMSSKWSQIGCPVLGEQIREILGGDLSTRSRRFFAKSAFLFIK